jgi:hypothetical protein
VESCAWSKSGSREGRKRKRKGEEKRVVTRENGCDGEKRQGRESSGAHICVVHIDRSDKKVQARVKSTSCILMFNVV